MVKFPKDKVVFLPDTQSDVEKFLGLAYQGLYHDYEIVSFEPLPADAILLITVSRFHRQRMKRRKHTLHVFQRGVAYHMGVLPVDTRPGVTAHEILCEITALPC